jgi:predicted component of type VI protein secretion system
MQDWLNREVPMPAKLKIKNKTREWTEDLVDGKTFRVGRSQEAEIQLLNRSVSGLHTELKKGPEGWVIRDLGSTNGTYVNGSKVQIGQLSNGDLIQIGECDLVFVLIESKPAARKKPASTGDSTESGSEPATELNVEADASGDGTEIDEIIEIEDGDLKVLDADEVAGDRTESLDKEKKSRGRLE